MNTVATRRWRKCISPWIDTGDALWLSTLIIPRYCRVNPSSQRVESVFTPRSRSIRHCSDTVHGGFRTAVNRRLNAHCVKGALHSWKKSATWNPFCPVFRTLGKMGSQKGYLHVQEPKRVPYRTKNYSKEPKKVLKMVLKTHLEPFREPLLKGSTCGTAKEPFFFLRV